MSDTTDATRHDPTGTTAGRDERDSENAIVMSVVDAAAMLGISRSAVRKRIERGQLAGHKQRGVWFVVLDATDTTGHDTTGTRQDNATTAVPDVARSQLELLRDTLLRPLIEQNERQQQMIAGQAARIGVLEMERDQLRDALERAAVSAPVPQNGSSITAPAGTPQRSSWRVWGWLTRRAS